MSKKKNSEIKWYCYILRNKYQPHKNRTYNGSTNNPKRRLRQHNQEITGGAKYTKKYGNKSWEIIALINGFPDHKNALQCEWRIKHPDNKKTRSSKYNSPLGRIKGLAQVLKLKQWTSRSLYENDKLNLDVLVLNDFRSELDNLPDNIKIISTDKINP